MKINPNYISQEVATLMNKRYVLSHDIMPVIKTLLSNHQPVDITISGYSMTPFYKHQKTVVTLVNAETLKPLDVILYENNKQYKLHRIIKISGDDFIITGDGLTQKEHIQKNQILGVVLKHKTHNKWINAHQFSYLTRVRLWIMLKPIRRLLLKLYKR